MHPVLTAQRDWCGGAGFFMRVLGRRSANNEAVTVAEADFRQHAYAIGATGSGKTTWLQSLTAADLAERRGFCCTDKPGCRIQSAWR